MAGRKPEVEDEEILAVFEEATDPILTSTEIAEVIGFSQPGTYKRLQDLADRGLLDSKKVGQGRAWWITDEGEAYLAEKLDEDSEN